jgi:GT2 family glycosyltransferase
MNQIPIIIPHFKDKEKLSKCLEAIKLQSYLNVEVFVRDNNEDNILFTAAINEGLKKFSFDESIKHILILNQDCYLQADTLNSLIETFKQNPKCGIACPIQIDERGSVFWGGSYEAFPLGRHQQNPLSSYTQDFSTYWANGACMLVSTDLIREIGFLDKNMRFICSDADYSFTARARGWDVIVSHRAFVEHSYGGSSTKTNEWLNAVKCNDIIYFANKWLTGDLFKSLSHEGESLSRLKIKSAVESFANQARISTSQLPSSTIR